VLAYCVPTPTSLPLAPLVPLYSTSPETPYSLTPYTLNWGAQFSGEEPCFGVGALVRGAHTRVCSLTASLLRSGAWCAHTCVLAYASLSLLPCSLVLLATPVFGARYSLWALNSGFSQFEGGTVEAGGLSPPRAGLPRANRALRI